MEQSLKALVLYLALLLQFHNAEQISTVPEAKLRVVTYNVWLFPAFLRLFSPISPSVKHRINTLPLALRPYEADVIVFQEVFSRPARRTLVNLMKQEGYVYVSKPLKGWFYQLHGGVLIVSRLPILEQDQLVFDAKHAEDALAAKGVIHTKLKWSRPDGSSSVIQLFGTHLQAGGQVEEGPVQARTAQIKQMKDFISSKLTESQQHVLIAGDMNIDRHQGEYYEEMKAVLNAREPDFIPSKRIYSFHSYKYSDEEPNPLAAPGPSSTGENELLDYVLESKEGALFNESRCSIERVEAKEAYPMIYLSKIWSRNSAKKLVSDLSDHYSIMCDFLIT